ncbi:MAG: hypothetical protein ACI4SN_01835 [Lachnospiraceae bacterium]
MPWCPKCRNEYREGIAVCAECGVELVDSLEECGKQAFIFGEKDKMERLQSFLAYNQIETAISYDEEDHTYQLSVGEMKLKQAVKMTQVFLQQEEQMSEEGQITEDGEQAYEDGNQEETVSSEREDLQGEQIEHHEEARGYHAYQNSATRAEDNRSSAYTLLAVGSIGFVVILLMFLGVIPVYQNAGMTKYLVCGVMGAMFILFIVFGVVSMRSSKVLFSKAKAEDSLMTEMEKWCQTNLSPAKVDEGLFEDEELPEEQKYFKRTDRMKSMISDKFLNLDEAFLDHFIDEYYQKLYEES